jgi:hypothetical protein
MLEEQLEEATEDSIGATEVDSSEAQEVIEGDGQSETTEDEQSDLSQDEIYYEIDGEEVSAEDIKKWKAGHLMQSDYTKKTQTLSEERKAFEQQQESLKDKIELFSGIESQLENLIMGDLSKTDFKEVLENEGAEAALLLQNQIEERRKALDPVLEEYKKAQEALVAENYAKLNKSLGWSDASKFEADKKAIEGYAIETGMNQRDFAKISSPEVMTAILEAAKYRKLMESKPEVTKQLKKAPKISKPAASREKKPLSLAQRMYPNMR